MLIKLPKIKHLSRYFLLIAIPLFFAYVNHWLDARLLLSFLGPPIYLAEQLRLLTQSLLPVLEQTDNFRFYALLLPCSLFYYGLLGLLVKQLWNEKGLVRLLSLLALIGFVVYIHYRASNSLIGYTL